MEAAGPAPHRPSRASREIAGLTGDYSLTRSESSTSAPDADGNFFSVALDDFSIHGLVGEGEFGKVMMATKKDTGQLYAMKVLRKEHLIFRGASSVKQALTEKQVGLTLTLARTLTLTLTLALTLTLTLTLALTRTACSTRSTWRACAWATTSGRR